MRRLWILGLVLGLTVAACGRKHTGFYEGTQPRPEAPAHMRGAAAVIKLELKGDGRFMYTRLTMPWEGNWVEEDGKIKLLIDSALGKDVIPGSALTPNNIEFTILADGSLKLSDSYVRRNEEVILKKVAK